MEDLYMSVGAMKDQKPKAEGSTRLAHTGLLGGLQHLKIETRLMDERFASVRGEGKIKRAEKKSTKCESNAKVVEIICRRVK